MVAWRACGRAAWRPGCGLLRGRRGGARLWGGARAPHSLSAGRRAARARLTFRSVAGRFICEPKKNERRPAALRDLPSRAVNPPSPIGRESAPRLSLSASSTASYQLVPGYTFVFDSAPFIVDSPPVNGRLRISPEFGEIALTEFRLDAMFWEDDDLPLSHRFSWQVPNATTWTMISSWSQASAPLGATPPGSQTGDPCRYSERGSDFRAGCGNFRPYPIPAHP